MPFRHNSTIAIKEKACSSCGRVGPIFSKGRCKQCSTVEGTQKRMEAETNKMISSEDLSGLIEDADAIVSLYVRLKAADELGNCQCYTCPKIAPYQELQCGHYIRRGNLLLRWDVDRNLRPQCSYCNCNKHGNLAKFAQNLERDQPGLPDILMEESVIVYKPSREEIRQIIAQYAPLVKSLKNKMPLQ